NVPSGAYSYSWRPDNLLASRVGGDTSTFAYDLAGHPTSLTDGAGRVTQTTYSRGGLPLEVQLRPSSTAPPDADMRVSYDAARHPTQVADGSGTIQSSYSWDNAGRLTAETYPQGSGSASASYGYDAAGNRTQRSVVGTGTTTYTYDAASQLRLSTDPSNVTTTYTYDGLGDPTQAVGPTTAA